MTDMKSFFEKRGEGNDEHPLLREVDAAKKRPGIDIQLEVRRPADVLGFKPAKAYIRCLDGSGATVSSFNDEWDDDLNEGLVRRKVKAISEDNEAIRFCLALRKGLETPETRFGDGYFNSVLVEWLKDEQVPFSRSATIGKLLEKVSAHQPSRNSSAYGDCRQMLEEIVGRRWQQLTKDLGYEPAQAERILDRAVAQYLDERFSITDRERLGW